MWAPSDPFRARLMDIVSSIRIIKQSIHKPYTALPVPVKLMRLLYRNIVIWFLCPVESQ